MANYYKSGSLGLIDAVAQSFAIGTEGGEFLTSVELYFQSIDSNVPVTIHIRTMNQGIPTATVLPFSEVTLNPGDSELKTASYDNAGILSNSTKFEFEVPVYVEQDTEYALCILANSKDYNVYISEIGQERIGTNTRITTQPSSGVFFTSQNASTWVPSPYKDLAYVINRAKFDINTSSVVNFVNVLDSPIAMINNPFQAVNSDLNIRIHHKNHGFSDGDIVYLTSSALSTIGVGNSVSYGNYSIGPVQSTTNNITGDTIYCISATVSEVEYNKFKTNLTHGTGSTSENFFGGGDWAIYTIKNYNMMMPTIETLNLLSTATTYESRFRNGIEFGSAAGAGSRNLDSSYSLIEESDENYFSNIKSIQNDITRSLGDGDIILKANLLSNNQYQTPIIDLERCSVLLTQNIVNDSSALSFHTHIPETDPTDGTNLAKYISREVILKDPAQNLKIFCDVNAPLEGNGDVELFYKIGSLDTDFSIIDWTSFRSHTIINDVAKTGDPEEFLEIEMDYDGATSFDKYCIKIVMTTTNSSYVPKCKNLRVIAYT